MHVVQQRRRTNKVVFDYTEFTLAVLFTVLDLHPTHEPAGNRKVNSTGESKLVHDSSVNGS